MHTYIHTYTHRKNNNTQEDNTSSRIQMSTSRQCRLWSLLICAWRRHPRLQHTWRLSPAIRVRVCVCMCMCMCTHSHTNSSIIKRKRRSHINMFSTCLCKSVYAHVSVYAHIRHLSSHADLTTTKCHYPPAIFPRSTFSQICEIAYQQQAVFDRYSAGVSRAAVDQFAFPSQVECGDVHCHRSRIRNQLNMTIQVQHITCRTHVQGTCITGCEDLRPPP